MFVYLMHSVLEVFISILL